MISHNSFDTIVIRHVAIDEGVVRLEEVINGAVFLEDILEELLGFLLHERLKTSIVVFAELLVVRWHGAELVQTQPGVSELAYEPAGLVIA